MTQLTHSEARSLLSRSLDASLNGGERRALDEHLAQCDACSAYAADLQRMNAHLFESLQERWANPNISSLEMDRSLRLTGQRVRQRSTGRRLMLVAQPAVWTIGAVALVAAMAWIISSIGPAPSESIDGTPTPTTETQQVTSTPAGVIASTATGAPTRGICTAEVETETDLREGPNDGYLSSRTVYPGTTGQVLGIFYEDPDTPWLQVYFKETATLEYVGWVLQSSVTVTGECKEIIQYVPSPTPKSATATAQAQNSTVGSANPDGDQVPVCYAALDLTKPPDHSVYTAPDAQWNVIGQVEDDEWYQVTGLFSEQGEFDRIWYRIDYNGQVGWVIGNWYYKLDGWGTDGCLTLESVAVALPTPTPSPTWEATATAHPSVSINDIIYVVPDAPNNVGTYAGSLPLAGGETTTYIGIRVNNIPQGMGYHLAIRVDCTGDTVDHFRWDYYGLPVTLNRTCGMDLGTPVSNSDNFRTLIVSLPEGGPPVGFTVTVIVEP